MKLIVKNNQVIEFLINEESLLSSQITRISIFYNKNQLNVKIEIKLNYSLNFTNILLHFTGVTQYFLNYTIDNYFYNIENFKFIEIEKQFYISFDPDEENNQYKSINDNDVILADQVFLYA